MSFMHSRSRQAVQSACILPRRSVHSIRPTTQVEQLDLASLRSVRAFAERWRRRKAPLHVLVNNAGIFSMGGLPWTVLGL